MQVLHLVGMNLTSFERVELWITRSCLFISFCIIGPTIILLTLDLLLWCFRASQEPSADLLRKSKSGIDLLQHHARRLSGSHGSMDRGSSSALKMSSAGKVKPRATTVDEDDATVSMNTEPTRNIVSREGQNTKRADEPDLTASGTIADTSIIDETEVITKIAGSYTNDHGLNSSEQLTSEPLKRSSIGRVADENADPSLQRDSAKKVNSSTTHVNNVPAVESRQRILLSDLNLGNAIE